MQTTIDVHMLVVGDSEAAVEAARFQVKRIALVHEGPAPEPKAGIRQFAGYRPVRLHKVGEKVTGVTFQKGATRLRVNARVIVDATETMKVMDLVGGEGVDGWCLIEDPPTYCANLGVKGMIWTGNGGKLAAWMVILAMRKGIEPDKLLDGSEQAIEELRLAMVSEGGIALWPFRDVQRTDPWFVAANLLAARSILPGSAEFEAQKPVSRGEIYTALLNAGLPFTAGRGEGAKMATLRDLYDALREAGKKPDESLAKGVSEPLLRLQLAMHLYDAIKEPPQSPRPSRP